MSVNNFGQPLRWYQRWSGVMLVGSGVAVLAIVLYIGGTTLYYYRQIKSGNGEILFQQIYGGFSKDNKNKTDKNVDVKRADLELVTAPYVGTNDPQVTVVEFIDFKCPNSKAEAPILKQVMQKYGSKVKLIVRNLPVESIHPGTNQLAVLAQCAYYQGWYWPLHDWLYANQDKIGDNFTSDDIDALSSMFGWDGAKMKTCFNSSDTKVIINKDYSDAVSFGVAGTPTFFINGKKVEGVIPVEAWDNFLRILK